MSRLFAFAPLLAACLAWVPPTHAQTARPGSLFVFPEYDTVGTQLLTVTNTNPDPILGNISTRWVYVDSATCTAESFDVPLRANDTYTVNVAALFSTPRRGYAYVLATHPVTGAPISFNALVGASLRIDPISGDAYELAPTVLRAIGPMGISTDVNQDGRPNLDGVEYEGAPDEIRIPRFLGQGSLAQSEFVLLSLSSVAAAPTLLNAIGYNDNEESFSFQWIFECWQKVPLAAVSGFFDETFLDVTGNSPNEIFGLSTQESGWLRLDGRRAEPPFGEAAILACVIDRIGNRPAAASVLGQGVQFDGALPALPVVAEPPTCSTNVVIPLWSPNHQIVEIDLAQVAQVTDPANLPVVISITSITQDEPINGAADGNTVCDGSGIGTSVARIRAERAGNGNGRVYVVNYTATNSQNLSCNGRITVEVPHSQNGSPAVDDGQAFASTEGCP